MIGVDPGSLCPLRELTDVSAAAERFAVAASDWIEEHYGREYFQWADHWHQIPQDMLARVFSFDELIYLWHHCVYASKLDDYLEKCEPVIWKVRHALWRYGCAWDYSRFVACYNGLRQLAVDLPDFQVRLTHTRFINTAGWATEGRDNPLYLDASFGVLLYYRGCHKMTIGFTPARAGILVAQVQLREKLGNRFLYKLPMGHLDFALALIQRAFSAEVLYLVTGESTIAAIQAAYGKKSTLLPETALRIQCFYNQSLQCYVRTGEPIRGSSDDGRMFTRLAPAACAPRSVPSRSWLLYAVTHSQVSLL